MITILNFSTKPSPIVFVAFVFIFSEIRHPVQVLGNFSTTLWMVIRIWLCSLVHGWFWQTCGRWDSRHTWTKKRNEENKSILSTFWLIEQLRVIYIPEYPWKYKFVTLSMLFEFFLKRCQPVLSTHITYSKPFVDFKTSPDPLVPINVNNLTMFLIFTRLCKNVWAVLETLYSLLPSSLQTSVIHKTINTVILTLLTCAFITK